MFFIAVGVLMIALKLAEVSPVATLAWWIVLMPFALAAAWWAFADSTGLTARRQADMVEAKAQKRRDQSLEALGVSSTAIAARRQADMARKALSDRVGRSG